MPALRRALIGLAMLMAPVAALADSWSLPTTQVYESPGGRVRLTVTPRDLASPLAYFEDKVAGRSEAGQRRGSARRTARGRLERLGADGRWTAIWDRPLVNDVAPVRAVVADSGSHVVTFDDWHAVGTGEHVVAIYGRDGTLVRSLTLSDILPDFYIAALPRSVSSIGWGGEHHIAPSGDAVILKIRVPSAPDDEARGRFVDLALDLATGRPSASAHPSWEAALSEARRVAEIRQAADAAAAAAHAAPLLGPSSAGDREWHEYLREAFFRLDPAWKDDHPAVKVLRAPTAANYAPSEQWLRDALLQTDSPADVIMIASPSSPENLVRVLTETAGRARPGSLGKARVYVAVDAGWRDRVAAALAPTGARLLPLDPAVPIPQRAERLPRRKPEG